jgi:hypothetical protein
VYVPAVAFAVGIGLDAIPSTSEIAVAVENSVGNVQDAPAAGEVNVTDAPATGALSAFAVRATNGALKGKDGAADCPLPENVDTEVTTEASMVVNWTAPVPDTLPALTSMLNSPRVVLAVSTGEVAMPLPFVTAVRVSDPPPGQVPRPAGTVYVTVTPAIAALN